MAAMRPASVWEGGYLMPLAEGERSLGRIFEGDGDEGET